VVEIAIFGSIRYEVRAIARKDIRLERCEQFTAAIQYELFGDSQ
jgi:hypothetical protein